MRFRNRTMAIADARRVCSESIAGVGQQAERGNQEGQGHEGAPRNEAAKLEDWEGVVHGCSVAAP
jgi:hypothetical protein